MFTVEDEALRRRNAGLASTLEGQAMRVAKKHVLKGRTIPSPGTSRAETIGRMKAPPRIMAEHSFTRGMYTTAFRIARLAHLGGNLDLI